MTIWQVLFHDTVSTGHSGCAPRHPGRWTLSCHRLARAWHREINKAIQAEAIQGHRYHHFYLEPLRRTASSSVCPQRFAPLFPLKILSSCSQRKVLKGVTLIQPNFACLHNAEAYLPQCCRAHSCPLAFWHLVLQKGLTMSRERWDCCWGLPVGHSFSTSPSLWLRGRWKGTTMSGPSNQESPFTWHTETLKGRTAWATVVE